MGVVRRGAGARRAPLLRSLLALGRAGGLVRHTPHGRRNLLLELWAVPPVCAGARGRLARTLARSAGSVAAGGGPAPVHLVGDRYTAHGRVLLARSAHPTRQDPRAAEFHRPPTIRGPRPRSSARATGHRARRAGAALSASCRAAQGRASPAQHPARRRGTVRPRAADRGRRWAIPRAAA